MAVHIDEPVMVLVSSAIAIASVTGLVWWSRTRAELRRLRSGKASDGQMLAGRFDQLEQSVEAIAIEVERIAEGQRFTTKLLSERQGPK